MTAYHGQYYVEFVSLSVRSLVSYQVNQFGLVSVSLVQFSFTVQDGRDGVVSIVLIRAGRSGVQIPVGATDLSVPHGVLTGCRTHPATCSTANHVLSRG
jgi:hypothetical protein